MPVYFPEKGSVVNARLLQTVLKSVKSAANVFAKIFDGQFVGNFLRRRFGIGFVA